MTWHAAARAADATAFARGVITSKLDLDVLSGPSDPVWSPLRSFVCSCDSLLWSCILKDLEHVIINPCLKGSWNILGHQASWSPTLARVSSRAI